MKTIPYIFQSFERIVREATMASWYVIKEVLF